MDPDDALNFLQSKIVPPDLGTNQPPPQQSLQQLYQTSGLGQASGGGEVQALAGLRGQQSEAEKQYRARTEVPGVPLDIETGASPWEKLMLSFRRAKEDQIKYLQDKYGEDNVRLDQEGGLILRVVGDNGKPKDLKVDEKDMSAKDLISIAGAFPEIAGGIIALKQGKSLPKVGGLKGILGLQRDVAATALGGEAAGTLKDVGVSSYDQDKFPDFPKIVKERGEMAIGDVALGEMSLGAGKLFNFFKAPLAGSRGAVQFDALAAQKYFKDKYGVEVPLSIGESTGSPIASRTETFMEQLPGGGTPFKQFKAEQEEAFRQLQRIMMGKTPLQDEPAGRAMIDALMQKIAPAETDVAQAAKTLGKVSTQQIENVIGGVTLPESQVFQSETGKAVRDAITAKRDAAKAEADRLYEEVRAAPGGEGKVFEAQPLQARFKEILSNLPTVETRTEVPTGILGPEGEPITRTQTGAQVMREFVPPNVLSRLQSVVGLKDAKFSLSDLQQMRREVYDDIARGEGVPGLGTHYLADIGKAITGAIDDGISALPSGELKTALAAANKFYKEKVIPFNRIGLTELFRAADEPGRISDAEVISRVFSGGATIDRYNLMKETLGENSPEFAKLKRAMLDKILETSRVDGDRLIDPKRLVQNLTRLRTDAPEVAQDMLGGKINELFRQAKFLEYAKGDKIDAQELQNLLKNKSPTVQSLRSMIASERKRTELYNNEILKNVADGSLGRTPLNPVEFVNRFVEDAKPSDIKQVMYMLRGNQPLVDDIRAKTVEKLFRDAARSATPTDLSKLLSQDPTRIVSGTSVFAQIESPTTLQKMRTILGPDIFNDLNQYIKLSAAVQEKERSFKAAGGLSAGMQIANLTRKGPLKYLYESSKDWVIAKLLTSTPMRAWLGNVPVSQEPGALSLILTSPQFLQQVAKEFPGAKGSMFVNSIKHSVDRWTKEQQQNPQAQQDYDRRNAALNFLSQP